MAGMIVPILALAMLHQNTESPQDSRGKFLFQNCQAAISIMDGPQQDATNYTPVFQCVDYIDGFVDGYTSRSGSNICMNQVSQGAIARIYVAYMEKHPNLLDQEKLIGMRESLADAYPCPAVK